MDIIEDIIQTNKGIFIKSYKGVVKNWKIFLIGIAYVIFTMLALRIIAYAWIFSGILIALLESLIISNYLYLIENIVSYDRFTIDDFKNGFTVYLRKIYSIVIIFWFVNFGVNLFLAPLFYIKIGPVSFWFLIQVIVFIFLNPLPETIYQKHYDGLNSITYSFEFIKENWIEWFIPNGIILVVLYLVYTLVNKFVLINTGGNINPFILRSLRLIVYSVFYQIFFSYIMIYRGYLFDILSTTTRRKRYFMRNIYK